MIISLIAAMSEERVIGRDGKLPWQIPADLTRFKTITMGHTVVMGRKTFQSIGRPLPGRRNIVLSKTVREIEGCEIAHSLQQAIAAAEGEEELFICGGQEIFKQALPLCQRIYLTVVHASYPGDVYFPEIPSPFQQTYIEERPELTPPLSFLVYEKVEPIRQGSGSARDLRLKGREAIQRQLYFLARNCLEQSLNLEDDASARSDLAFSMAKSGGDLQAALRLAEQAQTELQNDPHAHLNLGRIQIMAGEKEKGVATLRHAMQLGGGPEVIVTLAKLGIRRPPPIRSLPRTHPLNKYLGLFLTRIGLR
ncbi:dihydrofolate reductase [Geomonas sp.]|uniref:dihydrofolate reductase n=1 Tax=Geomonas sp. TaxID=2651584 RepID=UPI002B4607A0|nr:dihydrofolate reductase [Geomonas sp.]HJV34158.1 dihydrofolate reductase [Geomonas sp.]